MTKKICGSPFPFGAKIASDDHEIRLQAIDDTFGWLKQQNNLTVQDGEALWYVLLNESWKTDGWQNQPAFVHLK